MKSDKPLSRLTRQTTVGLMFVPYFEGIALEMQEGATYGAQNHPSESYISKWDDQDKRQDLCL